MEGIDGGAPGNAGGSGTDQVPAWLASMPDDLKADKTLAQFPSIGDAGKELVRLKGFEGKAIAIPDEKATDQERAAFYTKLGRPETADKYTITKPENLPESVTYSPEAEAAVRQVFHKANLTDSQAKVLHGWFYETVAAGEKANADKAQKALDAAVNTLKDEWKGDEFKVNTEIAHRGWMKFAGDNAEMKAFITNTKVGGLSLGDHPMFLRIFAAIGKATADDSMAGNRGGAGGEVDDETKAKARFPATYPKT